MPIASACEFPLVRATRIRKSKIGSRSHDVFVVTPSGEQPRVKPLHPPHVRSPDEPSPAARLKHNPASAATLTHPMQTSHPSADTA